MGWVMNEKHWWSHLLLWYYPFLLQNVNAALFPTGSKNPTAGSSFFALGFKCCSSLYTPQILFLSRAAGLVYSSSVYLTSAPSYFIAGFTDPSEYLRKAQPFRWSLSTNIVFTFQLVTLSLVWAEASAKVLMASHSFLKSREVVIPQCNVVTQSLKGLTEAYRSLHLSNSWKERELYKCPGEISFEKKHLGTGDFRLCHSCMQWGAMVNRNWWFQLNKLKLKVLLLQPNHLSLVPAQVCTGCLHIPRTAVGREGLLCPLLDKAVLPGSGLS